MTLSETIFGRRVSELTQSDLESYFQTHKKESNNLEFKSYVDRPSQQGSATSRDKEKLNKIFTSICAFLNTGGGILIWGSPVGSKLPGETEDSYSGALTPVPTSLESDQISGKITSDISPLTSKVEFKPISLTGGGFCYVFEVRESDSTPHQVKGTYYIRVGASTHTMPHPLVEAMIKKITYPKLEGYIIFSEPYTWGGIYQIPITVMIYNGSEFINEKNLQYRILSVGCDIINPFKFRKPYIFQSGCDYQEDARPILHKNMPFHNELCLVTTPQLLTSKANKIYVSLTLWGDSSPVVHTYYEYETNIPRQGSGLELRIIEKSENKFLMDKSRELIRSGKLVSGADTHTQLATNWHTRYTTTSLYDYIRER
jgi:hypothetical protein